MPHVPPDSPTTFEEFLEIKEAAHKARLAAEKKRQQDFADKATKDYLEARLTLIKIAGKLGDMDGFLVQTLSDLPLEGSQFSGVAKIHVSADPFPYFLGIKKAAMTSDTVLDTKPTMVLVRSVVNATKQNSKWIEHHKGIPEKFYELFAGQVVAWKDHLGIYAKELK